MDHIFLWLQCAIVVAFGVGTTLAVVLNLDVWLW